MRIRRLDLAPVWVLAAVFFALQANTLRLETRPQSEEGMHAEAGQMIFEGWMPYQDFLHGHPPVLALLLGLGLTAFHSIPGLAEWDFRYVTVRPVANVLLILFLYIGVVHPDRRSGSALQTVLSILSVLTYYPSAANLLFASAAMIAAEPATSARRALLRRYATIGLVTTGVVLLFWVSMPGSFETTVMTRLRAPWYFGLTHRLGMWLDKPQLVMYPLGFASLLGGGILLPHLRPYSLAMAGMVAMTLVTREFVFHYFSLAGPALAFGAGTVVLVVRRLLRDRWTGLAYGVGLLVLVAHLVTTLPFRC